MKKMTAGRRLAVSIGMGAAVLTAGAPAVAAADTPDAGTGSSASTATDGSPVAAPSSESAGASNGTSPVSTPSTTAPGSTSVTVDSAEATGSVAPSSAATADSSAPATESTPSSAPGTPLDAALATGTPSPGSHQSPTVTATPPVDTPDQPYGKHAAPEPSSTPSVVSGAESALVTSHSPAPTMPEGATADVTEYTPYVDWRSDAEVTSLESISGKEAVVSEAPVENEISSTGTAPVAATALALTTMGAGAATTRPRLTANSTPEEVAAYYAWIEETKTASQVADATNEYWNYGDDDWTAAWNTGDPTADGAFIKTGAPAGLTYSVDDSRVTLHNNSTTDVAVVGLLYPDYSSQGVTVIRAGESYTIEESGSNPLGVNGYIVQTARQDGKPVLIGQITTMQSSLMPFSVTVAPVTSTHQQSDYILLQGTSVIDPSHADPGDRFVDQNEYLASIGSDGSPSLIRHFVNPEPAGVSYSKNSDGSTTIFNDGTDDIAISQSTTGGQILAFHILKPGQRATYTAVPGSPVSSVEVQAPRSHSNEYNVLGAVTFAYTVTGPVSSSPGNGIPAIPVHDAPLPENHAPSGTLEAQQKPANQRTMDYVAHVSDIDGDSLTYSIVKQPTNGVVTNHGDGTFTFTPTDPVDLHDGVVGKPVTAWDLLAGDFTTMPDNSFVVEVSDGKGGSSRIGAIVYYMFTEEDNTPPGVTVTGGQSGVGEGAWKISIDDADGDRTTYYVGTQPAFGRASSSTPYTTEDGVVHDDHLIFYTPDLVRAHQGAYDDTFTVTVNDGHYGGLVSTPVSVHVPFHNYAPTVDVYPVDTPARGHSLTYSVSAHDEDSDPLTVTATTAGGGSVTMKDSTITYVPQASTSPISYDKIRVTVSDGFDASSTETTVMIVNVSKVVGVSGVDGSADALLVVDADSDTARNVLEATHNGGSFLSGNSYDVDGAQLFLAAVSAYFAKQDIDDVISQIKTVNKRVTLGRAIGWGAFESSLFTTEEMETYHNRLKTVEGSALSPRVREYYKEQLRQNARAELKARVVARETAHPVKTYLGSALKVLGGAMVVYSIEQAADELMNAKTDEEKSVATMHLVFASAPVVGAGVGCAVGAVGAGLISAGVGSVGGCLLGARAGYAIGSAVSTASVLTEGIYNLATNPTIQRSVSEAGTAAWDYATSHAKSSGEGVARAMRSGEQQIEQGAKWATDTSDKFFNWAHNTLPH